MNFEAYDSEKNVRLYVKVYANHYGEVKLGEDAELN